MSCLQDGSYEDQPQLAAARVVEEPGGGNVDVNTQEVVRSTNSGDSDSAVSSGDLPVAKAIGLV